MGPVDLTIDQLSLDNENPRIDSAASQREALQKVIADEPEKLLRLGRSIVRRGLNPMDRLLVFRPAGTRTYVVADGNRRLAAMKVLVNPTALAAINIDEAIRRRWEELAKSFAQDKIEPIACFDAGSRENTRYWVRLRHTGENDGEGVVAWKTIAQSRFLGGEPALEVLQFVKAYGGLSDAQLDKIDRRFNLTTLRRLVESRAVREKIGIDVKDGVIHSGLPAEELIKPLRRFVVDISNDDVSSRKLHSVQDQLRYVEGFDAESRPSLSKSAAARPIGEIAPKPATAKQAKSRERGSVTDPSSRSYVIPRAARLKITDPKIGAIATELKGLYVEKFAHAVSVLFRVFLELSTDHYMTANALPTAVKDPNRGDVPKTLDKKVHESIEHMIAQGARKKDFDALSRALRDKQSPLYIHLLHGYVHNLFVIPKPYNLLAAWDEARPYFERIWA